MATSKPINMGTGKAPNQLINFITLSNPGLWVDCTAFEISRSMADGGNNAAIKVKKINPEHRIINKQIRTLFLFDVMVFPKLYKITKKQKYKSKSQIDYLIV